MSSSAEVQAAELHSVIERFNALSECAIRAVGAGDEIALAAALDARDLLTKRAGTLSAALSAAQRAAPDLATRKLIDTLLHPAQRSAQTAASLNADLTARAQSARDDIRAQLDRLTHDDAARAAYSSAAFRGDDQHFDIIR